MGELRILPVTGIGEVRPGDDLAEIIAGHASWLADGDVVVVTSKIVSKSEGRLVELPRSGPGREAARLAVLAAETARPVATRGPVRIVQTHHGFVLASAGIDASNVDSSRLVLLPVDPDASAAALRAALRERTGRNVAVVVTDTMGRAWRMGLVDVAIGAAGVEPLLDYRGRRDAYGNDLEVTVTAVADELAAAAELVKGKLDGVPVAVVRGWSVLADGPGPGAKTLVRSAEQDMFRLGTDEARAEGLTAGRAEGLTAGLRLAAELLGPRPFAGGLQPTADRTADQAADKAADRTADRTVDKAVGLAGADEPAALLRVTGDPERGKLLTLLPEYTIEVVVPTAPADDPLACAAAGAAVQRLRAALAAEGLASAWVGCDGTAVADLLGLPAGRTPLGVVAIGIAPA